MLEAGLVTTTSNARAGKTAASGAALGGPGWLYGQARQWAGRDAAGPAPRGWSTPKGGTSGAGGPKLWVAGQAAKAASGAGPHAVALNQLDPQPAAAPAAVTSTNGRRRIGDGRSAGRETGNGS
jgi:hypothetical protein